MPELIKVPNSDYWTNGVDQKTGESVNYVEISTWFDGTPMNDSKCDGVIYRKQPVSVGGGYVKRVYTGAISIDWFGAISDASFDENTQTYIGTDNSIAFQRARDYAESVQFTHPKNHSPVEIQFNGKYLISTSPNWAIEKLQLVGIGKSEIICTGTGPVINLNNNAGTRPIYNMRVSNLLLTGNQDTENILDIRDVSHSIFENITVRNADPLTGKGLYAEHMVCNQFINFSCALNQTPGWLSPPRWGIYLQQHLTKGANTANTFINNIIEWVGIGIELGASGSDFNSFINGTSEGNSDIGVIVNTGCRGNIFENYALEANINGDFIDRGITTTIKGGYSNSIIKTEGSRLFKLIGSYCNRIELNSTTAQASILQSIVNRGSDPNFAGGIFSATRSIALNGVFDLQNNSIIKETNNVFYRALNTSSNYTLTPTHDIEVWEVVPSSPTSILIQETDYTKIGTIIKIKNNATFPVTIAGVTGVTINGLVGTAITLNDIGDTAEIVLSQSLNAWRTVDNGIRATPTEVLVGTDDLKIVTPLGQRRALESYAPFIVLVRTSNTTLNPSFRGISLINITSALSTHTLSTDIVGEGLTGQVIEFSNQSTFSMDIVVGAGVTLDGTSGQTITKATGGYLKIIRTSTNNWRTILSI